MPAAKAADKDAKSTAPKRRRTTTRSKPTVINCEEIVDISSISDLHKSFIKMLDKKHKEIIVDVSKIERIDTAGIQLLCSFQSEIKEAGIPFHWRDPSDTFCSTAHQLGLDSCMELA
ncbi:MAG: lipid asymmetry maintenance protein MlaB [Gammaproteobacteria bacterium]